MNNDRGSAVVIVLMILGVTSLMGAALITQSKMDMQFSSSVRSYENTFAKADGAAALALSYLNQNKDETAFTTAFTNTRAGGGAASTYTFNVPLPSILTDTNKLRSGTPAILGGSDVICSAKIIKDRYETGTPNKTYYIVQGQARSLLTSKWDPSGSSLTSDEISRLPTSTVEIAVVHNKY